MLYRFFLKMITHIKLRQHSYVYIWIGLIKLPLFSFLKVSEYDYGLLWMVLTTSCAYRSLNTQIL